MNLNGDGVQDIQYPLLRLYRPDGVSRSGAEYLMDLAHRSVFKFENIIGVGEGRDGLFLQDHLLGLPDGIDHTCYELKTIHEYMTDAELFFLDRHHTEPSRPSTYFRTYFRTISLVWSSKNSAPQAL